MIKARLLPVIATLLAGAGTLSAGEPLGTNLFGGYSFQDVSDPSRHGANLALDFRAFGPVAAFVDVGSHWGSETGVGLHDLTLMAGPGVRFGNRWGTAFFVRALAGLVRDKASIDVLDVTISESNTDFAWMAGGGVDFRVSRKLAARVQADYVWQEKMEGPPPTPAGTVGLPSSGHASGFRVSAGVVYRFGTAP